MFADAHLAARGFFVDMRQTDGPVRRLPGLPWRIVDGAQPRHQAAPVIGQHTVVILQRILGMSVDEIESLKVAGALS
jgi:crotonobetainyl-CoA:carnitine CoA-transferase CaiB-like acyl-CoA transferase